jgi:hypothetical protein
VPLPVPPMVRLRSLSWPNSRELDDGLPTKSEDSEVDIDMPAHLTSSYISQQEEEEYELKDDIRFAI